MTAPTNCGRGVPPSGNLAAMHEPARFRRRLTVGPLEFDAVGEMDPMWRRLGPGSQFLGTDAGLNCNSRLRTVDWCNLVND